jgi:hypothetical protein
LSLVLNECVARLRVMPPDCAGVPVPSVFSRQHGDAIASGAVNALCATIADAHKFPAV